MLKKERQFLVSETFIKSALIERYNRVVDDWGDSASIALWDDYLEFLLDCGYLNNSPDFLVDNYFINGDFRIREDETDAEWDELCQESFIYTDQYALLQL